MKAEEIVKTKWPNAVALNSSAYGAWVILENPSSNHMLSVNYPQPATAGTESAAWSDAVARMSSEDFVKAHFPRANAWWDGDVCVIRTPTFTRKMVELNSLNGDEEFSTEAQAWEDADDRIGKEHA